MTGVIDINECSKGFVVGKTIGVIGIGKMGLGIAISLIRNKATVVCCSNRDRKGVNTILSLGGREASSPKELAEQCDVIILSLPKTDDVRNVCLGERGIAYAHREKLLIIDTTTGDPRQTSILVAELSSRGIEYVDAPLTRGPLEARRGKLNAILGAPDQLVAQVSSVLQAFCEFIIHVGSVGEGQKMKLINNALSMGVVALTADAINLAATLGISIEEFKILVSRGGVNNDLSQALFKWACKADGEPLNFSIDNAFKDLNYCLGLSNGKAESLPMINAAHFVFKSKVNDGGGQSSLPSLVKV